MELRNLHILPGARDEVHIRQKSGAHGSSGVSLQACVENTSEDLQDKTQLLVLNVMLQAEELTVLIAKLMLKAAVKINC